MPGRPSISRRKDASERGCQSKINKYGIEEITKVGRQMTCKNCWEVGHNSRGCKNQKKDAPIKQKNPTGRPKGRMSQALDSVSDRDSRGRSSIGRGSRGRSSTGRGVVSGRGSRGNNRPQLGADAMTGALQVPFDEGAPPSGFIEDSVQLDAALTNEQSNPSELAKRLKLV